MRVHAQPERSNVETAKVGIVGASGLPGLAGLGTAVGAVGRGCLVRAIAVRTGITRADTVSIIKSLDRVSLLMLQGANVS